MRFLKFKSYFGWTLTNIPNPKFLQLCFLAQLYPIFWLELFIKLEWISEILNLITDFNTDFNILYFFYFDPLQVHALFALGLVD